MNNYNITNLADPVLNGDAVTKAYVDSNIGISQTFADSRYYLNTTTLNEIVAPTSSVQLNLQKIVNLADATLSTDALNVQTADSRYYSNTTTLDSITAPSADISANLYKITDLANPTLDTDASTKKYVDDNKGISQTNADTRYYLNTVPLNSINAPTGDITLGSYKITNLGNASNPTDALNQQSADFRYYLNTVALDDITAPTSNVSMNNHKITNLATPTISTDSATK